VINLSIQQGELAYWLGVLAAPGGDAETVPKHVAEALQILRCIEAEGDGFRVTDKGLLALRMADPAAIHHR
jgi:hypothetical protein